MKIVAKKILNVILRLYYKKKVTYIGKGQKFYLTTNIKSTNRSDVILHGNVRVHGAIVSKFGGKVEMGEYSQLGPNSRLLCIQSIWIGAYTAIGPNVTVVDNNNHPVNPNQRLKMRITPEGSELRSWKYSASKPIRIGENVWIGENVRICKGVTIGNNAVIAACSVVTKDVPANAIAAGNPAKIVKTDIDKIDDIK